MKLSTCTNGHFYDADKYASCPYCVPQDEAEAVTEALKTEDFSAQAAQTPQPAPAPAAPKKQPTFVNTAVNGWEEPEDDENCTVGYYAQVIGVEPVVGWLVCIKGAYRGESFKLKSGRNFIGRAANMDIVLGADQSVSRLRHAAASGDKADDLVSRDRITAFGETHADVMAAFDHDRTLVFTGLCTLLVLGHTL